MIISKKLFIGLGLTAAGVLAIAAPASAHVTISPTNATQGGYTTLTFKVPAEEDNANTTKVELDIPIDNPIASVSIEPQAGWTYTTQMSKLATPITDDDGQVTEAVSQVVWTATGDGLKPGEFDEFKIAVGPLPDTGRIVFKALQTYSNGDVVRWIDPPTTTGNEPEHPAPVLSLSPASATGSDSMDSNSMSADAMPSVTSTHYAKHSSVVTSLVIGIAGLVVGLVGFALALTAIIKKKNA